ncbi:mucin-2-like [Physella acuta]|uniref:mucin-2-like n=1 Tax=Physella acuta TaxID=109671 RepID=UPI0027DD34C8|nr:mucin-2-like [Physella acuta]
MHAVLCWICVSLVMVSVWSDTAITFHVNGFSIVFDSLNIVRLFACFAESSIYCVIRIRPASVIQQRYDVYNTTAEPSNVRQDWNFSNVYMCTSPSNASSQSLWCTLVISDVQADYVMTSKCRQFYVTSVRGNSSTYAILWSQSSDVIDYTLSEMDNSVINVEPCDMTPALDTDTTIRSTNISTTVSAYQSTSVLTTASTTVPTSELTTVPTSESTTISTSESTTVPTPESTTVPTSQSTTISTSELTTVPTSQSTTVPTSLSTNVPTSELATVPTSQSTTVPTSQLLTYQSTTVPTSQSTTLPTFESTTVPTSVSSTVTTYKSTTSQSTTVPTSQSTTLPTSQSTTITTPQSTTVPTSQSTIVTTSELTPPELTNTTYSTEQYLDFSSVASHATAEAWMPNTTNRSPSTELLGGSWTFSSSYTQSSGASADYNDETHSLIQPSSRDVSAISLSVTTPRGYHDNSQELSSEEVTYIVTVTLVVTIAGCILTVISLAVRRRCLSHKSGQTEFKNTSLPITPVSSVTFV